MVHERNETQTKRMVGKGHSRMYLKFHLFDSRIKEKKFEIHSRGGMASSDYIWREEIEDDSKYPSLESYLDGNAINTGGETEKGLGGKKINADNYSFSQQIKMLAFFKWIWVSKHLHFILRKQAFKIYFHLSTARQIVTLV